MKEKKILLVNVMDHLGEWDMSTGDVYLSGNYLGNATYVDTAIEMMYKEANDRMYASIN
jgi:hypothetical protein